MFEYFHRHGACKRSETAMALTLMVVFAAMWWACEPIGNFPLNDDWVYALAVRSILETGRFSLPSRSLANVFAQAYWGALFCWPFGFSFTALRISSGVLGAVGVGSCYLLLRELGARRAMAGFGALTLAVNPVYLEMSLTFMTDTPFTALLTVSLWLHVRGVARGERGSLVLAYLIALAAILVRQFALVLPLAFAAGQLMREGFRPPAWLRAGVPLVTAILMQMSYEHWLAQTGRTAVVALPLMAIVGAGPTQSLTRMVVQGVMSLPYVGLFILPFGVFAYGQPLSWWPAGGWRSNMRLRVAGICGGAVAATLTATQKLPPALGNTLQGYGLAPLTLRDTYLLHENLPLIPRGVSVVWAVLGYAGVALSAIALFVLLDQASRAWHALANPATRRRHWAAVTLGVAFAAYCGGMILLGSGPLLFDRYMLPPLVMMLGLMVLDQRATNPKSRRWPTVAALVAVLGFGTFAIMASHDYLSWNRARLAATDGLMGAGISPTRIDGGYEFNGMYLHDTAYEERLGKSFWWVIDDEYVIAAGPLRGYHEVARVTVDRWLGLLPAAVVVLRRDEPTR